MRNLSTVLSLLLFAICLGCKKPPIFTVKVDPQTSFYFKKYKIVVDGHEVAASNEKQALQFDAPGHAADAPKKMLSGVEVQVLSVCGWEKAEPLISGLAGDEVQRAQTEHRNPVARMDIDFQKDSWKTFEVLVDNRGGQAARLSVGEYEERVEAGDTPRLTFPYMPHCDQADQLRFNGEPIGSLKALWGADTGGQLLLDTSGSRCYRYEWRTYSNTPVGVPGLNGTKVMPAQKLRGLSGQVNYFLAPLRSHEWSSDSIVTRASLQEIPCR